MGCTGLRLTSPRAFPWLLACKTSYLKLISLSILSLLLFGSQSQLRRKRLWKTPNVLLMLHAVQWLLPLRKPHRLCTACKIEQSGYVGFRSHVQTEEAFSVCYHLPIRWQPLRQVLLGHRGDSDACVHNDSRSRKQAPGCEHHGEFCFFPFSS